MGAQAVSGRASVIQRAGEGESPPPRLQREPGLGAWRGNHLATTFGVHTRRPPTSGMRGLRASSLAVGVLGGCAHGGQAQGPHPPHDKMQASGRLGPPVPGPMGAAEPHQDATDVGCPSEEGHTDGPQGPLSPRGPVRAHLLLRVRGTHQGQWQQATASSFQTAPCPSPSPLPGAPRGQAGVRLGSALLLHEKFANHPGNQWGRKPSCWTSPR